LFQSILKLIKQSAIYGFGHILSRSIGFLLLPLHTNFISPHDYALYIYGYAFIPFVAIFYSAGINSAQLRYYLLAKDEVDKYKIVTTALITTLVISLLLSILFFLFSDTCAQLVFNNTHYGFLIRISCGIMLFDALLLILFNILRAEEKAVRFVLLNLLNVFLTIFLNVFFIVYLKKGISGIFIANLIASVVTFCVLILLTHRSIARQFSLPLAKELSGFGFPLIPSVLSMVVLTMCDRFIIRELMGDEAAGVYGAAYKLGMFMNLIITAFRYAWHPFYLSTASEDANAKLIFSKVLTYFLFFCGFVFLVISIFIKEMVQFQMFGLHLFGKEYWGGVAIVPIIMASYIFYGIYLNFEVGIYLENKTKYLAVVTVLSALLNILANFLLIPYFGLNGAAYATLLAYMFMASSLYFYVNRFYKIPYEWLRLTKIAITSMLLYFGGTLSYPDKSAALKLLIIGAYFIVLYVIGFFEKEEIKKLKELLK